MKRWIWTGLLVALAVGCAPSEREPELTLTYAPLSLPLQQSATVTVPRPRLDSLRACQVQERGQVRSAGTRSDTAIARFDRGEGTGPAYRTVLTGLRGAIRGSETVSTRCLSIVDAILGVTPQPPPDTIITVPPDTIIPQPPPPGGGTVLAGSDWSTCAGVTNLCWLDGQTFWQTAPSGQPPRTMEVVTAATAGGWTLTPNVMQVSMLGPNGNGFVSSNTVIPQGQSYYLRFYVKVATGSTAATNHSINIDWQAPIQQILHAIHPAQGGSTYQPFYNINSANGGGQGQYHGPALNNGEWYRFEFFVDIYDTAALRFRAWPRIYNAAGALIADEDDYRNQQGGTLAAFFAGGGYAQANSLDKLRKFAMGNEGPAQSQNTGHKWFYAAAAVSLTGWVGPR